jgi:hypothetical protein
MFTFDVSDELSYSVSLWSPSFEIENQNTRTIFAWSFEKQAFYVASFFEF